MSGTITTITNQLVTSSFYSVSDTSAQPGTQADRAEWRGG